MKLLRFLFFNRLTKYILTAGLNDPRDKMDKRITAYGLELVYPALALFPLIFLMMFVIPVIHNLIAGHDFNEYYRLTTMTLIQSVLFILGSNKDYFDGQSIVHRTYGFKVVDNKSNLTASEVQCLIRNLTATFYPIEFVFVILNRQRRIGDFIAGTRLIQVEKTDPELILREIECTDFQQKSKVALMSAIIMAALWTVWVWSAH